MASLIDTYSSSIPSVPPVLDAAAQDQAGIDTGRLTDIYQNRALPQLRDRWASRGAWYAGHRQQAEDQLNQDFQQQTGDVQRNLQNTMAQLKQRRVLATYGGDPATIAGAF